MYMSELHGKIEFPTQLLLQLDFTVFSLLCIVLSFLFLPGICQSFFHERLSAAHETPEKPQSNIVVEKTSSETRLSGSNECSSASHYRKA